MKFTLFAACFVAALLSATASSEAGHFLPKAFFTLDSEGHKSDVHPVSPHTAHYLRRLRRQTFTSSSSSSSSSSGDGGHTFFTQSTQSNNGGPTHFTQTAGVVPTFDVASRFGEDSASGAGFAASAGIPAGGFVHQTAGIIYPSGQAHTISQQTNYDAHGNPIYSKPVEKHT